MPSVLVQKCVLLARMPFEGNRLVLVTDSTGDMESEKSLGSYAIELFLGMLGHLCTELRVGSDFRKSDSSQTHQIGTVEPNRNSARISVNFLKTTLHEPKFCVKLGVASRNCELET